MIQLYFLSVLCNGLAGYVLFSENTGEIEKQYSVIYNPTFSLVLGIMSAVVGILKLLSPVNKGIFFLGDLIPAAAGIVAGLVFIFGIYRQDAVSEKAGELDRIGSNLLIFRKPISFALMGASLLHFIFGEIIFL